MNTNKYLNFGYLSLIPVTFGIIISASVVNAVTLPQDNAVCLDPKPYELAEGKSTNEEQIELKVNGMTCGACSKSVKSALLKVTGVTDAVVSHEEGKAVVIIEKGKAKTDELIKAVENAGFSASKK
ncbi:MAG TPA: heavy-metal-associated domain-containing protein [Candidatus Wunengus californicus]|uniref:heavy-metal-associated domain-containing protein n=1 Tax=Candidatus Wunengus californicus TaxID=3367619 RepID=UPI00402A3DE3